MNLHRVSLRVLDYNARALRCYEKCGFASKGARGRRDSATGAGATRS
jgi:RimJ/RimL family protein N-acetyltransferase